MFVRFKPAGGWRLKAYIVESVRANGKVRQTSLAYLGGIDTRLLGPQPDEGREAASIQARVAFWEAVNPKLKALANRVGGDDAVKRLRIAVHARIPWPMQAERDRSGQLAAVAEAEHEHKRWHDLYELTTAQAADQDKLAATIAEKTSEIRKSGLNAIAQANMWKQEARTRRQRLE